jgi:hypothetical protein
LVTKKQGLAVRLAYGANRNRHAGRGIRGRQHVAAAVKDTAWVDHHAGRVNFAGDDAFGLNLDAAFCENYAIKAAGNHDAVSFDLAFDFGAFTEDYGLLGNDVAAHVAVDAKRSSELQRTFEGYALVDKAGPLFADAILCGTGPLPCHDISPRATLLL